MPTRVAGTKGAGGKPTFTGDEGAKGSWRRTATPKAEVWQEGYTAVQAATASSAFQALFS